MSDATRAALVRPWSPVGFVQRRSDGGVRLMTAPLSRRFVIGSGKLEEIATICASKHIDAVIFANDLSAYQRRWLSTRLGRPVLTGTDLEHSGASLIIQTGPQPRTGRGRRPRRR